MIEKIQSLWPEILLFATACVVMVIGLSPKAAVRQLCSPLCAVALLAAAYVAWTTTPASHAALPHLAQYAKTLAALVGVLLLLVLTGSPDREYEAAVARGTVYDPLRATRAEFYSFFLFSISGLMLCAGADDLILLFLALELTSLPTYIMVTLSTQRNRSMEAGVKYFFLGALGAAIFLYGFALLYGGTGTTRIFAPPGEPSIATALTAQMSEGHLNAISMAGLILSVLGICFKIAAVPMHFYTPDVYQGASAGVAAFLAFVPKTAGFLSLMILCSATGWWLGVSPDPSGTLPEPLNSVLILIAVLTMTVGNVMALLQSSVKRILAYSSIAHSGYMLVGLIAGPGTPKGGFTSSGLAAVLFYLLSYGVMNLGAFAVLASLERKARDGITDEADDIGDLRGLCTTRPLLGWTMVLSAMGLLGLPPLLGVFAKLPLFTAGITAGHIPLVIVLGINSAIAAYYYIRLAALPLLEKPDLTASQTLHQAPFAARMVAGALSAIGVVVLVGWPLTHFARDAAQYRQTRLVEPAVVKPHGTASLSQHD